MAARPAAKKAAKPARRRPRRSRPPSLPRRRPRRSRPPSLLRRSCGEVDRPACREEDRCEEGCGEVDRPACREEGRREEGCGEVDHPACREEGRCEEGCGEVDHPAPRRRPLRSRPPACREEGCGEVDRQACREEGRCEEGCGEVDHQALRHGDRATRRHVAREASGKCDGHARRKTRSQGRSVGFSRSRIGAAPGSSPRGPLGLAPVGAEHIADFGRNLVAQVAGHRVRRGGRACPGPRDLRPAASSACPGRPE